MTAAPPPPGRTHRKGSPGHGLEEGSRTGRAGHGDAGTERDCRGNLLPGHGAVYGSASVIAPLLLALSERFPIKKIIIKTSDLVYLKIAYSSSD